MQENIKAISSIIEEARRFVDRYQTKYNYTKGSDTKGQSADDDINKMFIDIDLDLAILEAMDSRLKSGAENIRLPLKLKIYQTDKKLAYLIFDLLGYTAIADDEPYPGTNEPPVHGDPIIQRLKAYLQSSLFGAGNELKDENETIHIQQIIEAISAGIEGKQS